MIEIAEENWVRLGYSRNVPAELYTTIQAIDVQLGSGGQGADFSGTFGHEEGREEEEGEEEGCSLIEGRRCSNLHAVACSTYEARCQRTIT